MYKIQLKTLSEGTHSFEYVLDDNFFQKIDSPEVQKGNLKAVVSVKTGSTYELDFEINGIAVVSCDRCLDDMDQPISYNGNLFVKFGDDFSQEDDIVIVPEREGEINIAWFLYEFVVLSIPIKHVHAFGLCNRKMASELNKHLVQDFSEEEDSFSENEQETSEQDNESYEVDPRWNDLKNIIDNDNNN